MTMGISIGAALMIFSAGVYASRLRNRQLKKTAATTATESLNKDKNVNDAPTIVESIPSCPPVDWDCEKNDDLGGNPYSNDATSPRIISSSASSPRFERANTMARERKGGIAFCFENDDGT